MSKKFNFVESPMEFFCLFNVSDLEDLKHRLKLNLLVNYAFHKGLLEKPIGDAMIT